MSDTAERLLREAALTIRNLICRIDGAEPRSEFSLITEIFDYLAAPPSDTMSAEDHSLDATARRPAGGEVTHSNSYLREVGVIAKVMEDGPIEEMAKALSEVKGRLFFVGIGGSAANASHAVNDFRKLCGIESYTPTDNVAELTAIANDEGWIGIYSKWLHESNLRTPDALFVLSVGGGTDTVSVPLKLAINVAKARGCKVFGIVGKEGGYTKAEGDHVIVIPTVNKARVTPHTEAFQSVILHLLVSHPLLQKNKTKW
jgi:D-sedoheptulose 7-phosphate isomerase